MNYRKNFAMPLWSVIIACGFIFSASAAQRTIIVSGTVVDSASNQPISQAMVVLYDAANLKIDSTGDIANMLSKLQLDTAFSGTDGKFSYSMKVDAASLILLYGVIKQGYQFGYSMGFLTSTTVELGTIKLQKINDAVKDTIMVSGTVVDSVTLTPVGNCLITFTGIDGFDTIGNTAITSADGTFSKQATISSSSSKTFAFVTIKDGYAPSGGEQQYSGKQVNLGTIEIKKSNAAVLPGKGTISLTMKPTDIKVFSLDGRLLYSGPIGASDKGMRSIHGLALYSIFANGKCLIKNAKIALP